MKISRLISVFGCMVLLSACQTSDTVEETQEQINSSLKICVTENDKNWYIDSALKEFEKEFPDVTVKLHVIKNEEIDNEKEKIVADLMAGNGDDLYINLGSYFEDVYKIQSTGMFEDLMPWFEKEQDFKADDYVKGTFDLYEDGNECYVVPLMAGFDALAIPKQMQKELNLNADAWTSEDDIKDGITKFYEKYPDQIAFTSSGPLHIGPMGYGFRIWKENMEVFDDPELKDMEALYKRQAYPENKCIITYDYDTYIHEYEKAISGERPCLGIKFFVMRLEDYIRMGGENNVTLVPVFAKEPGIYSNCSFENAISSRSTNKENAFRMLTFIMQNLFENNIDGTVKKSSNQELLDHLRSEYQKEKVIIDGEVYDGLTEKTFEKLEKWFDELEVYSEGQEDLGNRFYECMIPYYEGTKSYEECIDDFKKSMEIYYSE